MSSFFSNPTSFRLNNPDLSSWGISANSTAAGLLLQTMSMSVIDSSREHSNHPPISNLLLLVFEAVLEVVCVSLPGYIIARQGMFDVTAQKFLANLNVSLFTPCLSKFLSSFYHSSQFFCCFVY